MRGENIAATTLFSASDSDGDAITAYQFEDLTTGAGSGSWIVGGVTQPAGQPINVTPAQLASASFQSGSGSDELMVRASDGLLWGDWTTFNVNAPIDHAPVVSGNDITVGPATSTPLPNLFSVSDTDGDPITNYELMGNTTLGGLIVVTNSNTNPFLSPGQNYFVDPSSFNQHTFFDSGSSAASGQISLRAFDGTLWSNWLTINVTTT
jgi:hypothetical protein